MKHLTLTFLVCLLLPAFALAEEFEKNILTGGASGTYIQIGKDLAVLKRSCGLTLNVHETAGSLENLAGVRRKANTQFGIVQSDVLEYLKTYEANDPELQRAIAGVRIMFPLYNEEIHIMAKREIAGLSDLAGKKVAIGVKDSGTFLTSTLILDIMQLDDVERLQINSGEALKMLLNGEIDAFVYVAGAPTKLFQDQNIDGARFHLLPVVDPRLRASYLTSNLKAGTYPFQTEDVPMITVKAVLMTFEYQVKKNRYQRESCSAVSDLSYLMLANIENLKSEGHPKWNEVDFTAIPPGWKVGNCVKAGMAKNYKLECKSPVQAAISGNQAHTVDDEYLKLLKDRLKK